jgi:hypothetical protein
MLIITRPQTEDIPKLMNHKKLLFDDPSNYLKLPKELNFNFIIGKKNKIKKIIPTRKLTKKSTSNFIKMLAKRATRMRSSNSLSFDIKRAFESNKKISLNNEEDKNTLRKKREEEVSNIFSKYRKIITQNEKDNRENIDYNSEVPSFMKLYINNNLSKQEKALKCKEEYNNIFKQMEKNISKTMLRDSKTPIISLKNDFQNKFYETANLFKNSVNNYRNKIEKIKLSTKRKKKNLQLDSGIRYWEMSLRRPKNFTGLRKGYLNISSDKRPVWIIATEKYPVEEEKIINPNIINKIEQQKLNTNYKEKSNRLIFSKLKNKTMNFLKYNDLQIKGKKLIDFEEKLADKLNGNIKILNFKYEKESLKDLLFKMNISINKYSQD